MLLLLVPACSNRSKILSRSSCAMPPPRSVTTSRTEPEFLPFLNMTDTGMLFPYFKAFESRCPITSFDPHGIPIAHHAVRHLN